MLLTRSEIRECWEKFSLGAKLPQPGILLWSEQCHLYPEATMRNLLERSKGKPFHIDVAAKYTALE